MIALFFVMLIPFCSYADTVPVSTENIQLQKLIDKSETQIKALKEILNYKKEDAAALDKANKILEKMSSGIDKSLKKYQGTEIYEKALLDSQSKQDFKKTYSDAKEVRSEMPTQLLQKSQQHFDELTQFQKDSVRANQTDLARQKQLEQDLEKAEPGFVPKLSTEVELGSWKANTRMSSQITELLSAVQAMREELRLLRLKNENTDTLGLLVKGSEIQNNKLKEEDRK